MPTSCVDQGVLALVCDRRRLARVIVPCDDQDPAIRVRAGDVSMLEWIARPVDPGSFPVPDGKDTILGGLRYRSEHLRAPDGSGGEILVDAWLEDDVIALEQVGGAP